MKNTVYGIAVPAPRITRTAAVLVAVLVSVPVFVFLTLIDWLLI